MDTNAGHQHGKPDNEREWLESLLGKGKGDPDMQANYPGEAEVLTPNQNQDDTSELINP